MTHYKKLLDPGVYIGPQDFDEPKKLTVSKIVREKETEDADSGQAPMMYFSYNGKELTRKYKVPKTVMYGLSQTFGVDADNWIGKEVTLYRTHCSAFGEIEECVRIEFTPEVEAKIMKWMKKRKLNGKMYKCQGPK